MKKLNTLMILFLLGFNITMAQVPSAFNYQAVVRNNSGELIADQNVSFRISILQNSESGTAVYTETHAAHTNSFGLVTLKIGMGTPVTGIFNPGGWGAALHFLKVETDPAGGSAYTHMGTSQLLAVPYAFHAQTVENDEVNDADADPDNELQQLSISGTQLTLSDGGGTVTLPSSGGGDNWGTQSVVTDATLSGNGTSASPLKVVGDLSDNQTLSLSGSNLSISGGNSVTVPLSPWTIGEDIAYYGEKNLVVGENDNSAAKIKSGNISIPPKFLIETEDKGSLKLVNESASQSGLSVFNASGQAAGFYANSHLYGTYFGNDGSGPCVLFGDKIKISDGTQGTGKVLTSDADGLASWQTPASSSSLWTKTGNHILYSTGNVAIGEEEPLDGIKLRVESTAINQIAIRAANNSSTYGALYAINEGSGPSALFASHIKIQDGTQGSGKVLTSDANGKAEWQNPVKPIAYGAIKNDGTIYSSSGNITVTKPSTGRYEVTISGISYYYADYTCNITLSSIVGFGRASSMAGKLIIYTYEKDGNASDASFNFIVF
ncbi:MAG: hypothetical protein AB7S72_06215 [Draconibacterium sp.]